MQVKAPLAELKKKNKCCHKKWPSKKKLFNLGTILSGAIKLLLSWPFPSLSGDPANPYYYYYYYCYLIKGWIRQWHVGTFGILVQCMVMNISGYCQWAEGITPCPFQTLND